MKDFFSNLTFTNGLPFPDTLTINATGAGTGDGTEIVKAFMDELMGGFNSILDAAGLTPDGLTEAPGTSQLVEAIQKIAGSPGEGVIWWKNSDPATTGDRVLLLTGQVVLIADYQEMVDATYVGDGNNPAASAFYKTSDAGGTTRSISGTYFVLPDTRGYTLRGLDTAASIDPDGASRDLGSAQTDAFQGHQIQVIPQQGDGTWNTNNPFTIREAGPATTAWGRANTTGGDSADRIGTAKIFGTDGVNGTPRVTSETRMINIATKYGIRY